jgi:Flp pilus assembly pilin Flp
VSAGRAPTRPAPLYRQALFVFNRDGRRPVFNIGKHKHAMTPVSIVTEDRREFRSQGRTIKAADVRIFETTMLSILRRLMKNQDGVTAIEYVLLVSLISVAAITSMRTVGGKVINVLSNAANAMN